MHALIRGGLVAVLAATLAGSALAPGMAQATRPAWHTANPPLIQWAPAHEVRTVAQGGGRTYVTWYRTSVELDDAVFAVHPPAGLNTPTPAITRAAVSPHVWHRLSFVITAPASMAIGTYEGGTVSLASGRDHDSDGDDVSRPFTFAVRVVPAPVGVVIHWTPVGLGTITVHRGETVTETVSFISDVALSNAQVVNLLKLPHVHITFLTANPGTVAAHTPVNVSFTISADADAAIAVHPTDLHIVASVNSNPSVRLWHDLDFRVDVDRAPPPPVAHLTWTPTSPATYAAITRGTSATEAAAFTTNVALTNVTLNATLGDAAKDRGLTITVAPATIASIAAGATTSVSFTIAVPATVKRPGPYSGMVWVVAQPAGAAAPRVLHTALHFVFSVTK